MVVDLPVPEVVEVDPMLRPQSVPHKSRTKRDSPVLDLLRHRQERLLDIRGVLRGGLQEWDAQLVRKFLHVAASMSGVAMLQRHERTFAALYSTTFLLVRSDLLPTSSLFTPSEA